MPSMSRSGFDLAVFPARRIIVMYMPHAVFRSISCEIQKCAIETSLLSTPL